MAIVSYAAGKYGLDLDGSPNGFLSSVDGGKVSAPVISEVSSFQHVKLKHLGAPEWEDISVSMGVSMGKGVLGWIQDTLAFKPSPKNGAIVTLDQSMKVQWEKSFTQAWLSSITFPAVDVASKDPVYINLKFTPTLVKDAAGSGGAWTKEQAKGQKLFNAHNFKLEIDGLDCTKIKKVDAITMNQKVIRDSTGHERECDSVPGGCDFDTPIRITLSAATMASWQKWSDTMVRQGEGHDGGAEKSGQLDYLSPDLKTTLFSVKFFNLGISSIMKNKNDPKGGDVTTATAELYCERFEFIPGSLVG